MSLLKGAVSLHLIHSSLDAFTAQGNTRAPTALDQTLNCNSLGLQTLKSKRFFLGGLLDPCCRFSSKPVASQASSKREALHPEDPKELTSQPKAPNGPKPTRPQAITTTHPHPRLPLGSRRRRPKPSMRRVGCTPETRPRLQDFKDTMPCSRGLGAQGLLRIDACTDMCPANRGNMEKVKFLGIANCARNRKVFLPQ